MNSASIIIGLAILAAVILPFVILSIRKRNKDYQNIQEFINTGLKYGLELSETEQWSDRLLGLDPVKRKILFRQFNNDQFTETIFDLNEAKSCSLLVTNLQTAGASQAPDKIEIVFKQKGNKAVENLQLYNSETDQVVYTQFEIGEKWTKLINDSLR
ncbi:MAG: hypothetical protein IPO32_11790 [Crocinitomicaceae bacterium]|jgi:uncharacterized protein related to proFAR isomerase|nr:hypothetical protein [Crocinitomicaceae bacterium]MBK6950821.1 hypothetical protein [Crocinitomicaceae bacterium]MBK9592146.1 hypothetical protein [Crocinitomicaceae bacterium]